MIDIEHLHPITVHFAIAPVLTAAIFDVIWFYLKIDWLEKASYINYIIAGIFGLLAVITGLEAEQDVIITSSASQTFNNHEILAFIFISGIIIQMLWRIGLNGRFPVKLIKIYILLIIINIFTTIFTGYYGGKLVFKYGVGVKVIQSEEINSNQSLDKQESKIQFLKPDSIDN